MHKMSGLVTAPQQQTEDLADEICEDIMAYRTNPVKIIGVPAGVLLNLIGRLGAAEMAINDLWSRINGADLPDYR